MKALFSLGLLTSDYPKNDPLVPQDSGRPIFQAKPRVFEKTRGDASD